MNLKTKIKKYSQNTLHRYLVVGGSMYLLEMLIILLAQKLGASAVLAVGISFWVGLIVSFLLTKFVTFSDNRKNSKVVLAQSLAYGALVLFNFFFALMVAKLLENIAPAIVSRTISLLVTTIWNYFLYKKHIFTKYTEIM
ncbi:GtrA family protein [bacterium]|nr:GtrA family protein [bacterium]